MVIVINNSGAYRGLSDLWTCTQLCVAIFSMEKACGAIDIERSTTISEANIFLAVLMIIPFRGRKRRLIVVTNIVSSNRTWTTTLSLEKSSRVVPEDVETD